MIGHKAMSSFYGNGINLLDGLFLGQGGLLWLQGTYSCLWYFCMLYYKPPLVILTFYSKEL